MKIISTKDYMVVNLGQSVLNNPSRILYPEYELSLER